MDAHLEKAKHILYNKHFFFMQHQVDEAVKEGKEVWTKEDMKFILSLDGLIYQRFMELQGFEEGAILGDMEIYQKGFLFQYIKRAKRDGFCGLRIWGQDPTTPECKRLKNDGYIIDPEMEGSTKVFFIFLNEESHVRYLVSDFNNTWKSLVSVSHLLVSNPGMKKHVESEIKKSEP